jgi:hypothetical protein
MWVSLRRRCFAHFDRMRGKAALFSLSWLLVSCAWPTNMEILKRIANLDPTLQPSEVVQTRSVFGTCVFAKVSTEVAVGPKTISQELFDPIVQESSKSGIWYSTNSLIEFAEAISLRSKPEFADHVTATGIDAKSCFKNADDFFAIAGMKDIALFVSTAGDTFLIVESKNPNTVYYLAGGI